MKPILFNTEMVRAILEDRKTVTRRVVKPQPPSKTHPMMFMTLPYSTGDILYVRETWTHTCIHCEHYMDAPFCVRRDCGTCPEFVYKADGVSLEGWPDERWHPSIHMPREAARIFLRVTDVRVETLQDITEYQAKMEGTTLPLEQQYDPEYAEYKGGYYNAFSELWNSTIKPADRALYGWNANPWVWVIEFERVSKEAAHGLDTP